MTITHNGDVHGSSSLWFSGFQARHHTGKRATLTERRTQCEEAQGDTAETVAAFDSADAGGTHLSSNDMHPKTRSRMPSSRACRWAVQPDGVCNMARWQRLPSHCKRVPFSCTSFSKAPGKTRAAKLSGYNERGSHVVASCCLQDDRNAVRARSFRELNANCRAARPPV